MSITSKQMLEFLERLEGPEGCNFKENENAKITWECKGGNNKDLSIKILTAMNIPTKDQVEFLTHCDELGGHCDCEILFNSAERLKAGSLPS